MRKEPQNKNNIKGFVQGEWLKKSNDVIVHVCVKKKTKNTNYTVYLL